MKTTITILALCLIGTISFAQAPAIQWQKTLGGTGDEKVNSIQPTPDGGYILAGTTTSYDGDVTGYHGGTSMCGNHGSQTCKNNDAWVVKLDAVGAIVWQKTLGGRENDEVNSIQPTPDGGYIMVGNTQSTDGDLTGINLGGEAWVVKLDATGTIVWQKGLVGYGPSGSGKVRAYSIQLTLDGGYITAGSITPFYTNRWVAKLDATGTIEWQSSVAGTSYDYLFSIQTTLDGGYIIGGYTESTDGAGWVYGYHGFVDAYVGKLTSSGSIEWQKALGGATGHDQAQSIKPTPDGGYIMVGFTQSTDGDATGNHGITDAWVVKLSTTGTIVWQKTLGGSSIDEANSIQTTIDGGYLVAGSAYSTNGDVTGNHGGQDAWLVKLDATGAIVWQKALGGTANDYANSIQSTTDGGYIVAGYTNSSDGDVTANHGGSDAWLVKLEPELSTTTFATQELKLYPNPAKSILQLQTATNASLDKITITDLTGKVIITQTTNTSQINIEPLAAGMYILEAISGEEKYCSKFVKE